MSEFIVPSRREAYGGVFSVENRLKHSIEKDTQMAKNH